MLKTEYKNHVLTAFLDGELDLDIPHVIGLEGRPLCGIMGREISGASAVLIVGRQGTQK